MSPSRGLGAWNAVRGCPGWHYGLFVRGTFRLVDERELVRYIPDGVVTFSVSRTDGTAVLSGLRASIYRTTGLARKMGERSLRGYQHEAQLAIRAFERGEPCPFVLTSAIYRKDTFVPASEPETYITHAGVGPLGALTIGPFPDGKKEACRYMAQTKLGGKPMRGWEVVALRPSELGQRELMTPSEYRDHIGAAA